MGHEHRPGHGSHLVQDADPPVTPYDVGVVLDPGEKPWIEVPARCPLDRLLPGLPGVSPQPAVTRWLVTNHRIVGRYADQTLHGWRWAWITGCLIDLSPGHERVHLDCRRVEYGSQTEWSGPGTAPLAIAAVYHLYGPRALLEHSGLGALRG